MESNQNIRLEPAYELLDQTNLSSYKYSKKNSNYKQNKQNTTDSIRTRYCSL